MDIMSVIFLVCGWVYGIKGLVITSIVLSSIGVFFEVFFSKSKLKPIEMAIFVVVLALSIVKLNIGF